MLVLLLDTRRGACGVIVEAADTEGVGVVAALDAIVRMELPPSCRGSDARYPVAFRTASVVSSCCSSPTCEAATQGGWHDRHFPYFAIVCCAPPDAAAAEPGPGWP